MPKTTKTGTTQLHLAATQGAAAALKKLLEHPTYRAQIDQQDPQGNTALHLAAKKNHADCAAELLKYNANADIKNNNNETPLNLAQKFNAFEVMPVLVAENLLRNLSSTPAVEPPSAARGSDQANLLKSKPQGPEKTCTIM